ncbi:hypothetical protein [Gordonia neofelifaecis]|uniref:TobH protein n=1 Tax=Gordonia neofelifaecis NRRL B-59395 TaxID=644548 RepID=F1YER6_9ACTN|nr:hypothetical protein [Gordonia neofelifaecis]EGD56899.1 hypothetical protein SCNU_00935 [Gordonia neofelifaecis NRRL B-59395]
MSALTTDLDDVDGLLAADRDGLLQSAAMTGAQVRAVSQAQSEGALERLADLRPRAVVVVTGASATARRAADLVAAVVAPRIDVPIITAPALPGWIGPLDVVAVAGDDAGDPALADAAMRTLRRRAELVAVAPVEGPLRDAIGSQPMVDLSPRLRVDDRFGFSRFVAALLAVCTALTAVRLTPAAPDLAELADRLDGEAAADHPGQESFHNQAKLLALRLADRPVAWAGDTPGAAVIAAHASAIAFAVAGTVSTATAEPVLALRLREGAAGAAPVDDIFYDPEIDPPRAASTRGILFTTAARRWYAERRSAALGDIDIVAEQPADGADGSGEPAPAAAMSAGDPFTETPADLGEYLVLALRAELAAVFVRLMGEAA